MAPSSTQILIRSNYIPRQATSNRTHTMHRVGDYTKLIHRFFETLILLQVLGQTRRTLDISPREAFTPQERRRRLLDNLAYLCDYDKGGETTAAIGLEEKPDRFIFWVSSNLRGANNKVKDFLAARLDEIKTIQRHGDERVSLEDRFTQRCIEFAKNRVSKEAKVLQNKIRQCITSLALEGNNEGSSLRRPEIDGCEEPN